MRSTGKRYTDDFKKMVIELYNSGKPVLELCSEYGITNPTLYNWQKKIQGNTNCTLSGRYGSVNLALDFFDEFYF